MQEKTDNLSVAFNQVRHMEKQIAHNTFDLSILNKKKGDEYEILSDNHK